MTLITALTPTLLHLVLCLTILLATLIVLRKKDTVGKLEKSKEELLNNILFLLENEEKHCEEHKFQQGKSLRTTMRNRVETESNLSWNSKYSKSACLSELNKIKNNKSKDQTFVVELFKGLLLKAVK